MKKARTSAYYPDDTAEKFGQLDVDQALAKFDGFPWATLAQKGEEIGRWDEGYVDATLTYRINDCHIMLRIQNDGASFDIEVCVDRPTKFLGIFQTQKFYEFESVPAHEARAALQVFFCRSDAEQHSYFGELAEKYKRQQWRE